MRHAFTERLRAGWDDLISSAVLAREILAALFDCIADMVSGGPLKSAARISRASTALEIRSSHPARRRSVKAWRMEFQPGGVRFARAARSCSDVGSRL